MRRRTTVLFVLLAFALVVAVSAAGLSPTTTGEQGSPEHLTKMILYAAVALVFSFLCSVAEAVILSISPSFVAHLQQQGRPLAKRLKKLKTNIDRSLAAILTLNTIAHTLGAGGAGGRQAEPPRHGEPGLREARQLRRLAADQRFVGGPA